MVKSYQFVQKHLTQAAQIVMFTQPSQDKLVLATYF
jgi:hypothetical protein